MEVRVETGYVIKTTSNGDTIRINTQTGDTWILDLGTLTWVKIEEE